MFGHIALAIPGSVAMFFVSMVLIVLGTGLLKPNVSSIVGDIYSQEDDRRDAGFSIFYMGINLGAFISPLIVGSEVYGNKFPFRFRYCRYWYVCRINCFYGNKEKSLGLAGTYVANPLSPTEKKKVYTIIWY